MQQLASLYPAHIDLMQQRTREALQREGIDGLVIHSGQSKRMFLDDNHYPFYVNPQFKAWLPVVDNPNCWLVVDGYTKPKLVFYRPEDFWHKVPDEPDTFWTSAFDIVYLKHADSVEKFLPYDKARFAYVGEYIEVARALGFDNINPDRVLHYLHYQRAYKTDYELACMREANRIAVDGHRAAKQAFFDAASEFDINLAYAKATRQGDNEVPYTSIVALNQNAAILHYMVREQNTPNRHLSFLIDAGASFHGYAADITRTYTTEPGLFADMIKGVDNMTLTLADMLKPGVSYTDVHLQAHSLMAKMLNEVGMINLCADDILVEQLTAPFFPHGIGHFLGLQVHDVAGHAADDRGTPKPPPEQHPFLRCTRTIEARQVFTIEPGFYCIPSLLADLRASQQSKFINWDVIDALRPFGGIRVEDNVIVHRERNENMTRELGLE